MDSATKQAQHQRQSLGDGQLFKKTHINSVESTWPDFSRALIFTILPSYLYISIEGGKGWFSHGVLGNFSHISEPALPLGQGEPPNPTCLSCPWGMPVFNTTILTRNNATHLLVKKAVEKSTRILQKSESSEIMPEGSNALADFFPKYFGTMEY